MPQSAAITESADEAHAIAGRFVAARLQGVALADYPGPLPRNLDEAYRRQDAALGLWPDTPVGWKVGKIPDAHVAILGEERLVGPIFASNLWTALGTAPVELPVIPGGFAAVEAEYVFRLGRDADPERLDWSSEDAADLVSALHVGVELAGSPLATINSLGPAVVVSDFGNNAGLILGPEILGWRERSMQSLTCATYIDGGLVGSGGAASIAGGPLAALAFALGRLARRGRPLKAGDLVSTGASTGIHDIRVGQSAHVDFLNLASLHCVAVPARAQAETLQRSLPA